jgi:hypothetical protein
MATTWRDAYEAAQLSLRQAHLAIEHLLDSSIASEHVGNIVLCAGNALQAVGALVDKAAEEQKLPRPTITLDISKILKTDRLRVGKKRRQEWDTRTNVLQQLRDLHRADPKQAERLMNIIFEALFSAKNEGLFAPAHSFDS